MWLWRRKSHSCCLLCFWTPQSGTHVWANSGPHCDDAALVHLGARCAQFRRISLLLGQYIYVMQWLFLCRISIDTRRLKLLNTIYYIYTHITLKYRKCNWMCHAKKPPLCIICSSKEKTMDAARAPFPFAFVWNSHHFCGAGGSAAH